MVTPAPAPALVLFDIDGTLLRRAGPQHGQALVDAARAVLGVETTLDGIPVAGMLDQDILAAMLDAAGVTARESQKSLARIIDTAQAMYQETCPDLTERVCPGVPEFLGRLEAAAVRMGLVTGNLTGIGWRKVERAGLWPFFSFGAFAETAATRAGLAGRAVSEARARGWIEDGTPVCLVGDHPNDIRAARENGLRSVAVATGVVGMEELVSHGADMVVPDLRGLNLEAILA